MEGTADELAPAKQKAMEDLARRARRLRISRENTFSETVCDLSRLKKQVLREYVPLMIESILRNGQGA